MGTYEDDTLPYPLSCKTSLMLSIIPGQKMAENQAITLKPGYIGIQMRHFSFFDSSLASQEQHITFFRNQFFNVYEKSLFEITKDLNYFERTLIKILRYSVFPYIKVEFLKALTKY